jgi:hypothetical protein
MSAGMVPNVKTHWFRFIFNHCTAQLDDGIDTLLVMESPKRL